MLVERRTTKRIRTNLDARWEGVLAHHTGTVTDLSITGCFILTVDKVKPKELIRVEIEMPAAEWVYLWGEVVYQVSEIGFALRFTGISDAEEELLLRHINDSPSDAVA